MPSRCRCQHHAACADSAVLPDAYDNSENSRWRIGWVSLFRVVCGSRVHPNDGVWMSGLVPLATPGLGLGCELPQRRHQGIPRPCSQRCRLLAGAPSHPCLQPSCRVPRITIGDPFGSDVAGAPQPHGRPLRRQCASYDFHRLDLSQVQDRNTNRQHLGQRRPVNYVKCAIPAGLPNYRPASRSAST
jgi:hypothetical protein